MRIPSTPRRTGARNKPVHFSYVSTERNQPFEAYLAGPVWWGYIHMLRPSKPCVYELTTGKVACRFCGAGKARVAVVKGWVPLYRRTDNWAVCVPVDEVQRDHLDALPTFTKVTVGRERGKGVGVWVRSCVNQEPKWESTLPECSAPADITESLLNMWALEELWAYFGRGSDSTMSPALGAVVTAERSAPTEGSTDAPQRYSGEDRMRVGGAVDDQVKRLLKHAAAAGSNGNGKHE